MRESAYNAVLARTALAVAAYTSTTNGATVDRHVLDNAFRSVGFAIHAGSMTDGTHTVVVEDSDDGSTWSAADAAHVQGAAPELTSSDSDTLHEVGYVGPRRYVRLTVTVSGATSGGTYGAVAVLTGGRREPVLRA